MINFATGIHGIQQLKAFLNHKNIEATVCSDHLIVKSAEKQIREIVEDIFCPIFSENKISGNVSVSMVPYRIHESFCKTSYLTLREISGLFAKAIFSFGVEDEDKWEVTNRSRKMVLSALNKGISEIIEKSAKKDLPIIEIGSGIGYSLSETISTMTSKTQVCAKECQLLSKSIKDPIYQMDIEGICKRLSTSDKKVSLFFALNVFDTLTPSVRKASLSQLSELQYSGDRLLFMLDTNPHINRILEDLHCLYPESAIFPYCPAEEGSGLSVIVIPLDKAPFNPSLDDFVACMSMEANAAFKGDSSDLQKGLREFQKKFNSIVINLEEFFVQTVQKDLEEAGYTTEVYYHAAFTVGQAKATMDIIYKRVTDILTVREWCPSDMNFINGLSKKGLKLPDQFNENFLRSMRMKGQKLLGAELLVIEAKKK